MYFEGADLSGEGLHQSIDSNGERKEAEAVELGLRPLRRLMGCPHVNVLPHVLFSKQNANERKANIDSQAPYLASLLLPASLPDPSTEHMPTLPQKLQEVQTRPSCVRCSYPGLLPSAYGMKQLLLLLSPAAFLAPNGKFKKRLISPDRSRKARATTSS